MEALKKLGVLVQLLILAGLVMVAAVALLSYSLDSPTWGMIIGLVILGVTVGVYTQTVPGYGARILIDPLTGIKRVIFEGLNFVLPWEGIVLDIDLRTDFKEVLPETYASKDALMDGRYVYTMRPKPTQEAILLFGSFQIDAVKMNGRAVFSMLLSDYYGKHNGEDLLDKAKINREVFEQEPGKSLIKEFEDKHGVEVTVRLEDSDFDAETQKARDTVSKARSIREAIHALMEGKDGQPGMSREMAEKTVRMMNIDGILEYNLNVSAPDLQNVRDITVLGGLGGDKGGKKK